MTPDLHEKAKTALRNAIGHDPEPLPRVLDRLRRATVDLELLADESQGDRERVVRVVVHQLRLSIRQLAELEQPSSGMSREDWNDVANGRDA